MWSAQSQCPLSHPAPPPPSEAGPAVALQGAVPTVRHLGGSPPGRLPSASLQAQGRHPTCGVLLDWPCTVLGWLHAPPWSPMPAGHMGN